MLHTNFCDERDSFIMKINYLTFNCSCPVFYSLKNIKNNYAKFTFKKNINMLRKCLKKIIKKFSYNPISQSYR